MATIKVEIIESEAGWGQKIDEVREFPTLEEAQDFITSYNSENVSQTVPEWYMYARLA